MGNDIQNRFQQAKQAIGNAEYIVIGGGAGLSDAAGLHYTGKRWTDNFASYIEKYGFKDLYTSSFYPFSTQEERWAYWAKHISINLYDTPATELYKDLFRLIKYEKYFVITTNADRQFVKAGFAADKVLAVQGEYGYFQCAYPCHDTLYDNEEQVKAMIAHTHDCLIPTSLVPKCPKCGGNVEVNLRGGAYFVQDKNWHDVAQSYENFVKKCEGTNVVFLELGVGFNTPGIIRYPFEQMTYQNKNATLIRLNRDYSSGAKENINRTIAFDEDMALVISALQSSTEK